MAAGFRRDSWVTKVPEEGDDLEEFEESDECQWFDDGVGGVAQAICTVHARVQCGDCSQVLSMAVVCCSVAFQIQLKCGCDAMLDLSPSSREISQSPEIPRVSVVVSTLPASFA